VEATLAVVDGRATIELARDVTIRSGQELAVELGG